MICDAHCHIDLMDDMMGFINEIQHSNISIYAVGTTPKSYSKEVKFCSNFQNIYVGLGMHPQLVSSGYEDMKLFKSLFEKSCYIGEVGLDFSKEYSQTKESQINVFCDIIKLCEQYGQKTVSIHSFKSASTVIEILQSYKMQKSNKYILHWFTGSISQLEKAIKLGCFFSINPRMLKTKSGMEIIKVIPIDRMLLETDAPFAFKAKHILEIEKEIKRMVLKISEVIGVDMWDIISKNSETVFQF